MAPSPSSLEHSWAQGRAQYRLWETYASADVKIPVRLISIPFVVYGRGNSRLPLDTSVSLDGPKNEEETLLPGFLLYIVARTRVVTQIDDSSEAV